MGTADLQEGSHEKSMSPGGITADEAKENIPHDCLESLSDPLAGAAQLLPWEWAATGPGWGLPLHPELHGPSCSTSLLFWMPQATPGSCTPTAVLGA